MWEPHLSCIGAAKLPALCILSSYAPISSQVIGHELSFGSLPGHFPWILWSFNHDLRQSPRSRNIAVTRSSGSKAIIWVSTRTGHKCIILATMTVTTSSPSTPSVAKWHPWSSGSTKAVLTLMTPTSMLPRYAPASRSEFIHQVTYYTVGRKLRLVRTRMVMIPPLSARWRCILIVFPTPFPSWRNVQFR